MEKNNIKEDVVQKKELPPLPTLKPKEKKEESNTKNKIKDEVVTKKELPLTRTIAQELKPE